MKNKELIMALFEKGISQKALSEGTGIPASYISMTINGKFNLGDSHKEKVANYLQIRVRDLFKKPSILNLR